MRDGVEIEDIEAMRLQVGIDDIALRQAIRHLHIGDLVVLTLLSGAGLRTSETWEVRITAMRGQVFRGKLARYLGGRSTGQRVGSRVAFRATHIHSLPKGRCIDDT